MLFSRYKRLGDDPDAIPPPPFGIPEDQYSPMPDGAPDYAPTDPNVGLTGGTSTGPAAQIAQQPDPAPSMRADSMDAAKDIKPIAGPPQPPPGLNAPPMPVPVRPSDRLDGNPLPKLPGMGAPAGAPMTPFQMAQAAQAKSAALTPPPPPKNNVFQNIGQSVLSMSRLGPQGAQAVIHPKYTQQLGQYGAQKADLADQIKGAETLGSLQSLDDARTEKADTSEQNAITNAAKAGIVFAPPGQTPPGDLVPTINPMAGRKGSPYANAQAFHDPNFGKFKVTAKQAELAGGALDGQVGNWLPMAELTGLIKAGAEQGKPVKETTVPVSPATATAMHLQTKPNADGTVNAPVSLLEKYNTSQDKTEKEPNVNGDLLAVRARGAKTGNAAVDSLSPQDALAALESKKEKPPGESNVGTWSIQEDADGKPIEYNSKTGQTRAIAPGGIQKAGTKAKADAAQEKLIGPGRDAMAYAADYLDKTAKGIPPTGPKDEALLEKFFELAKPSTGFKMTQQQIDMLKNAQSWMGSVEAKLRHATTGTWFSSTQRKQIVDAMSDLNAVKGGKSAPAQNNATPKQLPPAATPPPQGDMIPAQIPGYPPSQIHRGQKDQFLRDHPGAMVGQ